MSAEQRLWQHVLLAILGDLQSSSEHMLRERSFVTDMNLGSGETGCEIVEAIRKRCPDIRVIFVTATIDREDFRMIEGLKPNTVLTKPFQQKDFRAALNGCP